MGVTHWTVVGSSAASDENIRDRRRRATQRDPPRAARTHFDLVRNARHCVARQACKQSVAQFHGVYHFLPDFLPAPVEGIKAMRAARSVPDEFLEASAVAAENDATIPSTTGLDPARTRMIITRNLRFEPLAAAAEALARDIRYNMFRERWDVVQQALQIYNLAKGYTRNAHAASLVAHLKTMQSALGRTGRPRKVKPASGPVPQQH